MLLVIDVEATCNVGNSNALHEMEIIEIGAVWTDFSGNTFDSFSRFVNPIPISIAHFVV